MRSQNSTMNAKTVSCSLIDEALFFRVPEKNTLMVQRTDVSSSPKSSRQQIGVGSFLRNIKNFGRRSSPIGEGFKSMTMADTEKAAVFPTADKDLSLAKTLPSKLNELVQGTISTVKRVFARLRRYVQPT